MDGNARQAYRNEVQRLLSDLKVYLAGLEKHPDDQDLVGRVFRVMHTFSGSGWMFGFAEVSDLARYVETVYDQVRHEHRPASPQLLDLSRSACELLNQMLVDREDGEVDEGRKASVIREFLKLAFRGPGKHSDR